MLARLVRRLSSGAALLVAALALACQDDPTAPEAPPSARPTLDGAGTGGAPVASDKFDYSPGDSGLVTGGGWQPGEAVVLEFVETPQVHPAESLFTAATEAGDIRNRQYVLQDHDLRQSFTLIATGRTSGLSAQTTFTDGPFSPSPG